MAVVLLITTLLAVYQFQGSNAANSLAIFGNASRVVNHNMDFWTISLKEVESILEELIKNKSISSTADIAGGPGQPNLLFYIHNTPIYRQTSHL